MLIWPVPFDRLEAWWPEIGEALVPAIQEGDRRNAEQLRAELLCGALTAWRITEGADGYAATITGQTTDTGRLCFWVAYVGGRIDGSPHEKVHAMRELMAEFEDIARMLGCAEVRVEGRLRAWGRVLSDYEQRGEALRKVL